jgi:hypothetical protein
MPRELHIGGIGPNELSDLLLASTAALFNPPSPAICSQFPKAAEVCGKHAFALGRRDRPFEVAPEISRPCRTRFLLAQSCDSSPPWPSAPGPASQDIYEKRAFIRMHELADALERAGCASPDILIHCRAGTVVRLEWPPASGYLIDGRPQLGDRCEQLARFPPIPIWLASQTGDPTRIPRVGRTLAVGYVGGLARRLVKRGCPLRLEHEGSGGERSRRSSQEHSGLSPGVGTQPRSPGPSASGMRERVRKF